MIFDEKTMNFDEILMKKQVKKPEFLAVFNYSELSMQN